MYAVIFASGKHSRLLLAYGNSKPPLSGNQGNSEIDGARRGGGGGGGGAVGGCTLYFVRVRPRHFLFKRRLLRLTYTEY